VNAGPGSEAIREPYSFWSNQDSQEERWAHLLCFVAPLPR